MAGFAAKPIPETTACLFIFVEKGDLHGLRQLIGDGAAVDGRDGWGRTPLHLASAQAKLDLVVALINLKADVNAKDVRHVTPLHLACWGGHATVVQVLVTHGADVHAEDRAMRNPLYVSCGTGILGVVDVLLQGDVPPASLERALLSAIRREHPEVAERLLRYGPGMVPSNEALFLACGSNSTPMVKVLVRNGANLKYADIRHVTALHVAAGSASGTGAVRVLLDGGADLEAKCNLGATPLCWAVYQSNPHTVNLLLRRGANADVPSRSGTPLHSAVCLQNMALVNMLLRHGASANARDVEGGTPLLWACDLPGEEFVDTLLRHGADPNLVAQKSRQYPLHYAVGQSNSRMVKMLLDWSAQVDSGPDPFDTPLVLACSKERCDIIRLLLEYGPRLNPCRRRQLMTWVRDNGQSAVLDLLAMGENVEVEDMDL